ncbi:unnamed protein product [Rotaria sp. Silwood1]|nr:unnamed protein product [Rotaria sp. Silwood1]CAF4741496.1 unnamed protein product [Rotaria sp. Silwood1]
MNIAFSYASKIFAPMFNCFIFHDGDLIPENDYNIYECDQHGPRHLAPAVNELRYSLRQVGYGVNRPPNNVGRYKMIRYEKQIPSFNRFKTLSKWLRYSSDGIRQLSTLDYSIMSIETRSLFTHILVNFIRLATKTIDHLLEDLPKVK